jgi:uncharacterized membrane protein (DUF2068 family)
MTKHPIRNANETIEHALHLDARRKLRIVAVVDLVKGTLILAIAFGVLSARSHALENGGVSLLRLLDIDATLDIPRRFLAFLHAADTEHGLLSLAAVAYAAVRFIEAYGLWFVRNWARWLGLVSAGIYVPFELYYFIQDRSWTSFGVLSFNVIVLWLLWPRHGQFPPANRNTV